MSVIITNLGNLPGDTGSKAYGINNSGQVVGTCFDTSGREQGFLWQQGKMTALGTLPGYSSSEPVAINSAGQVAGTAISSLGSEHAFLWQNGVMTDLGAPSIDTISVGMSIDSYGNVVGTGETTGGVTANPFVYYGSFTHVLPGLPGGGNSEAYGTNASGDVVVGTAVASDGASAHAVMWKNGNITDLGIAAGSSMSFAYAANNAGQIAGFSIMGSAADILSGSETMQAFVWQGGTITSLASLSGSKSTMATSINAAGQIVGSATMDDGSSHAVLWQNGTATDLNTLLPANSGWDLKNALGINDNGQVVGSGTYDGTNAAFILSLNGPSAMTASNAVQSFQSGKIGTPVVVADSAANVQANLDGLQSVAAAGQLSSIALTDSGTPTLTVTATQLTQDATALGDISGNHNLVVGGVSVAAAQTFAGQPGVTGVAVSDSAADVMGNLGSLETLANAGKLSSITLTDGGTPTLTLIPGDAAIFSAALSKISGNCVLSLDASDPSLVIWGVAGQANIATFSGKADQYAITPSGDGSSFTVTDTGTGRSSTDHLSNISALQFSDHTDIVASQTPPAANAVSSAQVTELYSAVFGRTPDVAGLAFYQTYAAANPTTPFTQFAKWFLGSSEYTGDPAHAYAQSSAGDAQFITDSYNNLLHRAPASGDAAWYQTNVINPMLAGLTPGTAAYTAAETNARAQVLAYFSQSPEFLGDVTITAQHPADSQHWLVLV